MEEFFLKRFGHWFLETATEKSIEKSFEHSQVDLITALFYAGFWQFEESLE